jgi:hypothetical protein
MKSRFSKGDQEILLISVRGTLIYPEGAENIFVFVLAGLFEGALRYTLKV